MNKEIWKPILGYGTLYEVSNKGNSNVWILTNTNNSINEYNNVVKKQKRKNLLLS